MDARGAPPEAWGSSQDSAAQQAELPVGLDRPCRPKGCPLWPPNGGLMEWKLTRALPSGLPWLNGTRLRAGSPPPGLPVSSRIRPASLPQDRLLAMGPQVGLWGAEAVPSPERSPDITR